MSTTLHAAASNHRTIRLDPPPPRVVIAHDYLTQRGGAERVALALVRAFPGSRLVTSVYDPDGTFPEFADVDIETLPLDRVGAFRADPRRAFPLLARAWQRHVITDADVVICSSSGWAHGVTTSGAKVVYCHNPARWLYQPDDYLADAGLAARAARALLARRLTAWDRRAAGTADAYLVNSTVVADRVRRVYGRPATVVPPPISLNADGPQQPIPGVAPGFLLTVARSRGYKNVELVCEAVERMPDRRLVALGDLPPRPGGGRWSDRLHGAGRVTDAELRWLYANCSAVVSASHEDFGLTPLEGNLFGKPAVLLRAGGFLDTLVEGVTGCFIEAETPEAVRHALSTIPDVEPAVVQRHAEVYGPHVFAERVHAVATDVVARRAARREVITRPAEPSPARRRAELAPLG